MIPTDNPAEVVTKRLPDPRGHIPQTQRIKRIGPHLRGVKHHTQAVVVPNKPSKGAALTIKANRLNRCFKAWISKPAACSIEAFIRSTEDPNFISPALQILPSPKAFSSQRPSASFMRLSRTALKKTGLNFLIFLSTSA